MSANNIGSKSPGILSAGTAYTSIDSATMVTCESEVSLMAMDGLVEAISSSDDSSWIPASVSSSLVLSVMTSAREGVVCSIMAISSSIEGTGFTEGWLGEAAVRADIDKASP